MKENFLSLLRDIKPQIQEVLLAYNGIHEKKLHHADHENSLKSSNEIILILYRSK